MMKLQDFFTKEESKSASCGKRAKTYDTITHKELLEMSLAFQERPEFSDELLAIIKMSGARAGNAKTLHTIMKYHLSGVKTLFIAHGLGVSKSAVSAAIKKMMKNVRQFYLQIKK